MYQTTLTKNVMKLTDFCQRYQHREKYLAYCRECPNYEQRWSCPSLSFEPDAYLARFDTIELVGARIDLDAAAIAAADTPKKIKDTSWEILHTVRTDLANRLLKMEKLVPGSISLASGGCTWCTACTRPSGQPCRQPERMRYSLDAFGFDLTAITQEQLGIELQWCRDRLPDYYTLIHALLTQGPDKESIWQKANVVQ